MMRQYDLIERVKSYDSFANEDAINRAYVFSMKAHGTQKRASGDPYFSHPVEVAGILTELKLDSSSIVTGLLHDTVEDTLATLDDIEKHFGTEVRRLVDGVTKLSRLELQSERTQQAENFRKLLLAMSDDIRVLFVKLADRLHNMRTLHFIQNPDKRRRIATETLEIYTPLAERIGINRWKDELEDLAFAELNGEARDSILKRLVYLREQDGDIVNRVGKELENVLNSSGISASVSGREKRPYSIWRKMQRKNVEFEQLADIVAFRATVDSIDQCYHALGVIHSRYRLVPGRFKDYISTPKPNGYRSIHTTVIGPEKMRVEIQIRTSEMHEIAEMGLAAHWKYKNDDKTNTDGKQYRWLRELLDILEHASGPEEFLEHTKLEMFQDQVFCFTPKGEVIALPQSATPVDFAYAVHSQIGDRCVGAKVNGRMVPLRSQLHNGDQVEIVTSKAQTSSPTWLSFVATGRARARVRRFMRLKQREQFMSLGREIMAKAFRNAGHDINDKVLDLATKAFRLGGHEDLYVALGEGQLTSREVLLAVYPAPQVTENDKVVPIRRPRRPSDKSKDKNSAIAIRGLISGMALHYAGCCHPLPGDRIVGIVTTGKGVTIHTIDCDTLERFSDQPERWLDVAWNDEGGDESFVGRLYITIANEPGTLGSLSTLIAKGGGNINNLRIVNRSTDFFEMIVDVNVSNLKHLTNVVAALRAHPVVASVERARG